MEGKKVNRRDYLKYTGAGIGGLIVGGALGYLLKPSEVIKETVTVTAPAIERTVTITAKPTPSAPSYLFYFVTHATPHPFWDCVKKGALDAATIFNVNVQFPYMEKFSAEKQAEFFREALAAKPHGIGITAAVPEAIRPYVKEARDKGIPVVCLNTADPSGLTPYMAYIGADLYVQGRKVGEIGLKFAEKLGIKGGEAVVMIAEPGHVGLEARARGIKDVLAGAGINTSKLDTGPEFTKAFELLRSFLAAHPETKFIFGADAYTTNFSGLAIEKMPELKDKVVTGGFDINPVTLEMIKKGFLLFSHDQQPYAQGFYTVAELYTYLTAGVYPMSIETATGAVDATNVDEFTELANKGYKG